MDTRNSNQMDRDRFARGVSIEVLWPDGSMTIKGDDDRKPNCRIVSSAAHLMDEVDGLADSLPYRDAASREGQVRKVAANNSLDQSDKRSIAAHVASVPVIEGANRPMMVVVQFVSPPDWTIVEALGDEAWEDGSPSPLLCSATLRTADGASIDCCACPFSSVEERESAARRFALDGRLSAEQRRELVMRIGRTPVLRG